MLELRNWIMGPRSQNLEPGSWKLHSGDPGTFWVDEAWTAFRGSSKSGPANPVRRQRPKKQHSVIRAIFATLLQPTDISSSIAVGL